jgi:lactoylglutathione lyase
MKLNHILVLTTDLNTMELFWTELIGLHVGERPPFPFDGLWLYSGNQALIHVAEQPNSEFGQGSIAHVALECSQYPLLLKRLNNSKYPFTEKIVPLSNERQLFIQGPDGLVVEILYPLNEGNESINNAPHRAYHTNENITFLGGNIS